MNDGLLIYLQDHLAGARFAVNLLEGLAKQEADSRVSELAARLLVEVEQDREFLVNFIRRLGGDTSAVKEATAWIAEKAGRLKLDLDEPMGRFEAIELLSLGVLGKLALWNALRAARDNDPRLQGLDLDRLSKRAQSQFRNLESLRMELAASVLPVASPADANARVP
jgi:hypothetical protein